MTPTRTRWWKRERPWYQWMLLTAAALASMAGLGCVLLFALFFAFMETPYDGRDEVPFDRTAWLKAEHDREGLRYLMLRDLLEKHSLIGMRRAEVGALLGPPSQQHVLSVAGDAYYLGPERSWYPVDDSWLCLEFDLQDRVSLVRTLTD
jgi:hypothetical protein